MKIFLKNRKKKKEIKELLKAVKHAKNMREDIVSTELLNKLEISKNELISAIKSNDENLSDKVKDLEKLVDEIYPFQNRRGTREHVEVLIISVAAAMAIRAFFIEPFKIPTGSMQPTLNGITVESQSEPTWLDNPITKFPKWLITGESYKEIKAQTDGILMSTNQNRDSLVLNIGGINHYIPFYMCGRDSAAICLRPLKKYYRKGDVIASGKIITGDQIIVNKMKYNFSKPKRGDISVFDTRSIKYNGIRKNTFYIKRMVGIPNEEIQIKSHKIFADGKPIEFNHQMPYQHDGKLFDEEQIISLDNEEYLMLGDNTKKSMSLDGRFFGSVPREDFRGPAVFVYWPFREHWGTIN